MRKPKTRRSSLTARRSSTGRGGGGAVHGGVVDAFDRLPDDLVLAVLAGLASRATSPADLAAASLACRRFRGLASHPAVLSRASASAVAVRPSRWSEPAHRFLRRCAAAGSAHACYLLGMVWFYCLGSTAAGAALLARAASAGGVIGGGHAAATYALAVVRFNGSGGGKADKDPRAGVALCARAAWMGHGPALRELGHCLLDGYGARRDAAAGRHLLLHAAAREIATAASSWASRCRARVAGGRGVEDGGDAASRFLVEWWTLRGAAAKTGGDGGEDAELRLCAQARCGRRETRRHEFRRCAACGCASYCSRACQALDWKRAHRGQCGGGAARWLAAGNAN
ncbi:unnamed protein product [Urochloa humidicola]